MHTYIQYCSRDCEKRPSVGQPTVVPSHCYNLTKMKGISAKIASFDSPMQDLNKLRGFPTNPNVWMIMNLVTNQKIVRILLPRERVDPVSFSRF